MKTAQQLKAIKKAQDIYDDACIDALGTVNFRRLELYSRMLYIAEGRDPVILPPMDWGFISPDPNAEWHLNSFLNGKRK